MADQNPFALEKQIVTGTWVHKRHNTGDMQNNVKMKLVRWYSG